MDERIRFVIRLKDGESMASLCREFGISRKTGYRSSSAMKNVGWKGSRIVRGGPIGTPISCRYRLKLPLWWPSVRSRAGTRARFVSAGCGVCRRK